jgi:hypothetical protein
MGLKKTDAFAAVSLVLFFFSVVFVSGALGRTSAARDNWRNLATVLAVDALALYLLLSSRTPTGINDHNTLVTMTAAGYANAVYAVAAATG